MSTKVRAFRQISSCGEMDIIAAFEAVVGGSNPSGSTKNSTCEHKLIYYSRARGYCLMVGRVLAKDEVGVRFSLSAQQILKDSEGVDNESVEN